MNHIPIKKLKEIEAIFTKIFDKNKEYESAEDLDQFDKCRVDLPNHGLVLIENSYDSYYKLLGMLFEVPWFQENFSLDFVQPRFDETIRNNYANFKDGSLNVKALIENFANSLEQFIETRKFVIPIYGIRFSVGQLKIGRVIFTRNLPDDDPIVKKIEGITLKDQEFKIKYINPIKERSVAIVEEVGEPERGIEKAIITIEESLNVLRLFSASRPFDWSGKITLGPYGTLYNCISINMNSGSLGLFSVPYNKNEFGVWINEHSIKKMQENGLLILDRILVDKPSTKMEEQFYKAIKWFGLARRMDDPSIRFVAYYSVLDMLLSEKSNPEWERPIGEKIAEAVAFLLSDDYARRSKIKVFQKELWNIRSKIVHSGFSLDEKSNFLSGLQTTVSKVVIALLKRCDEFQTKDELKNWLEIQRLSSSK